MFSQGLFGQGFSLPPAMGLALFICAVFCGQRYRVHWKEEGRRGRLWLFGLGAGVSLAVLAVVPIGPAP